MNVHSRISAYTCPCCGGSIGEAAPLDQVRRFVTSSHKVKIFDMLAAEPGAPVYRRDVSAALYDGKVVGNVLASNVSQLRREIEPYGWTITYGKGGNTPLAQWRLIPTEAGQ
ncbi:hypothetical protein LH464_21445 [Neorhizobium sp. T786]|uniref:hypothetical protein n=1 Tax=Pseudorhizobium xiangyangii TaxID=2883104 RepID=UPI001CFF98FA|nr:hypothetical protein [Neorhizobium xiangyangii]MCB5205034.1 hypothetical protein [Neorhizobium xiangyangii]